MTLVPWNQYLYLVANVKGVIAVTDPYVNEVLLNLLVRKFRYRRIGVVAADDTAVAQYPQLEKEPFIRLAFPFPIPFSESHFPSETAAFLSKTVLLCSLYLAPLITVYGHRFVPETFATEAPIFHLENVRVDESDLKFNLRLGDYIMTDVASTFMQDFYRWLKSTASTSTADISSFLQQRAAAMVEDARTRFWRLLENPTPGRKYALAFEYIDPLPWFLQFGLLKDWLERLAGQPDLYLQLPLFTGPVINIQIDV
ncbi:MAG: hypothetical protein GXO78_15070 [Calditrichaeota bacterium]|nr:hypothetical protein [Calditrichota bacterium]